MADFKNLKKARGLLIKKMALIQDGGQIGARQSASQNKRVKATSCLGLKQFAS